MSDHNQPLRYRAYLLRCWQERSRQEVQPALWRFSLEDPHTGIRHGFATLEAVVAALQRELLAEDVLPRTSRSEHATAQNTQEAHHP